MPPPAASSALAAVSRPGLTGASDPLSHLLWVLRPRAVAVGAATGEDAAVFGGFTCHQSAFCIVLSGRSVVDAGARGLCIAETGDFIVFPDASKFTVEGIVNEARCLVGTMTFGCVDPSLFSTLLPPLLHVRGSTRREWLASLIDEEASWELRGSPVMLDRLVEVMLVDVLRHATAGRAPPGLLQGLGDARLAPALRGIHAQLDHPWTVAELAGLTDLRRSAFHVRFTQRLGASPMDYLLFWRMLVARELLRSWACGCEPGRSREDQRDLSAVASRVGYSCAASFIRAFHRHTGWTPGRFGRSISARSGLHS